MDPDAALVRGVVDVARPFRGEMPPKNPFADPLDIAPFPMLLDATEFVSDGRTW